MSVPSPKPQPREFVEEWTHKQTIGERDAIPGVEVSARFRSTQRGAAAASALAQKKSEKVAYSVTLTPSTFMRADEVDYQTLSKRMVSNIRHGREDGYNVNNVCF